jgi:3-methyladenine DNA glycosylase AlkD
VTCSEILKKLSSRRDPRAVAGMARFGITTKNVYGGWPAPELKRLAREIGRSHPLALDLWASEVYEARALATLIDDPAKVTKQQMDAWAGDFDNWAVCDGACINLFRYTKFAWAKCVEWSARQEEFVRRAAFALMAGLTVADKAAGDAAFLEFLPLIKRAAMDDRNFVKKAVNWALRQIGKRNKRLNGAAIAAAREIRGLDSPAARWIAADALRELESPEVQQRLKTEKPARGQARTQRVRGGVAPR